MNATGHPEETRDRLATTDLRLPLFHDSQVEGWPGDHTPVVAYVDTASLFLTSRASDAHTAAYSVPEIPHRLTLDGLGLLAAGDGWRIVLLHLDIDPPRKGEKPADEAGQAALRELRAAWWQAEQEKLVVLAQHHPGAFVY